MVLGHLHYVIRDMRIFWSADERHSSAVNLRLVAKLVTQYQPHCGTGTLGAAAPGASALNKRSTPNLGRIATN